MRIGIDCRTILNPEKGEGAGLGHYTYQLVRHLLKIDKKNTYFLFFDRSVQRKRLDKFRQKNVLIKFFPFKQYKKLLPNDYTYFLINAALAREKLDVFHSPTPSLPLFYKGSSVVTVHDLFGYKLPELFNGQESKIFGKTIPDVLKKTDRIIAVSKATAKDLEEIFHLDKQKIKVIYHGLDQRFFKKRKSIEINKIKKKYKIGDNYLLFLGTFEKRKNIIRLIGAYERWRNGLVRGVALKKDLSAYQLVLAGGKGQESENIRKRIKKSKYKKDIIVPGYIPSNDLGRLFSGATAFIFPSLYEGFGLPIIEAMAKRIPVITSNVSSLPEISQKAAFLVDPYNVAQIAQAINDILTNKNLNKKLKEKGSKRAKDFSWDKCARETLNVYKNLFTMNS
ncbi:MAG: glycosyltransferase family 1 protein [Patescibacteria group bacterium]|nr:glycosyltransferase family 1 protein [Patescibacteria group bacterium]MDD5172615.1 glycosyltransferase family 1 protein [Patescibacteria group bacterium]